MPEVSPIDGLREDEPAKPKRERPSAAPRAVANRDKEREILKQKIGENVVAISVIVGAFNQADAMDIAIGAPRLAEAYADLALESPAFKRLLNGLMTGGAWTGALAATAAIAIPIMQRHNTFPTIPFPGSTGVASADAGAANGSPPSAPGRPESPAEAAGL